jgi:predicted dehydrogenase
MSSYRVGIVGLSWITSEPANPGSHPVLGDAAPHSHLSALAAIPSATVVAGCDIVPEARNLFLQRWQEMWPGVKTYDDYAEMIRQERLDLICVATPDDRHGDVVRMAADAGVRAIFCEKPMSTHLADVDSMIEAIERNEAVATVNHTRRWMPSYVAAREKVRSGAIGDLVTIVVNFGGERAMLWRNQSHFLDLICYFAESDPAWVIAELEPGYENYGTAYRGDGGRNPDLEPSLNAYIVFRNGVRAFLGGMKHSTPQITVDLRGSTARIAVDDQAATLIKASDDGQTTVPIVPKGRTQGIQAALVDLITALETGREPQCPPREARKTVALIEGILASQAAGNARIEIG